MTDYYQLELDDMVIALNNKDADIERLQKKLDIAVKALKKIDPQNVPFKDFYHRGAILRSIARKALKEIKEV